MHDTDDLDALVNELNAESRRCMHRLHRSRRRSTTRPLPRLARATSSNATRAISCSWPVPLPSIRVDWRDRAATEGPLGGQEIADAIVPALPPHARKAFRDIGIADAIALASPISAASASTCITKRGRAAARDPAPAAGGAAPGVARTAARASRASTRLPRGLVAVGGPHRIRQDDDARGAGQRDQPARRAHIITIEDPIEYEHQHRRSRRRAGRDRHRCARFPTALRAALRQAPDVIVVGEMRDPETMQIAVHRRRDRAPRVLEPAHDRRGDDGGADRRLVSDWSVRTPSARSSRWRWPAVLTQTLMPRLSRRAGRLHSGRRIADRRLRRAAARAQERAAPSASGNHHHAQARFRSRSKNRSPTWSRVG